MTKHEMMIVDRNNCEYKYFKQMFRFFDSIYID